MNESINIPECDFGDSSYRISIDDKKYFKVSSMGDSEGPVRLVLGGLTPEEASKWNPHFTSNCESNDWMILLGIFSSEESANKFVEEMQNMTQPMRDFKSSLESIILNNPTDKNLQDSIQSIMNKKSSNKYNFIILILLTLLIISITMIFRNGW